MPLEMQVENGKVKIKTPEGDTIEQPVADFVAKNPELAGRLKATQVLDRLDVNASLALAMHPSEPGEIQVGDVVMVKAIRRIGHVVRTLGDAIRVEAANGAVNTYWKQELDRRRA
jgi:hypothetical protein